VGKDLYQTACGICHEAEHRAQMVPDLRTKLKNSDKNYWTKWISEGRPGSLMPAFAAQHGGILGVGQIETIVEYLETDYKKNPPPSNFKPAATPASATTGG
jgi:mono/diheme cytochrome c family protein